LIIPCIVAVKIYCQKIVEGIQDLDGAPTVEANIADAGKVAKIPYRTAEQRVPGDGLDRHDKAFPFCMP
jgi:hypothetical protein